MNAKLIAVGLGAAVLAYFMFGRGPSARAATRAGDLPPVSPARPQVNPTPLTPPTVNFAPGASYNAEQQAIGVGGQLAGQALAAWLSSGDDEDE